MGGDLIGSSLVPISTGIDYVKAVIQIALGEIPDLATKQAPKIAAVRFIFDEKDISIFENIKKEYPDYLVEYLINPFSKSPILDSSNRHGYFLIQADTINKIQKFLPKNVKE